METTETEQPILTAAHFGERPDEILFATIAAGGSHVSTAWAMAEALDRRHPGEFAASVREPMLEWGFEELDRRHKDGWRRALRNPWSIVWGQRLIDTLPAATVAFHRRLLRDFARRAAVELSASRPLLVVVNHGWLTVALTMAQREFGLDVPVLTFETSTLNANALWAERGTERFVTASNASRERLLRFGVPGARVDVVGYPVRQSFLCAPGKSEARSRAGLEDAFTCLVALGGEGVGGTPEAAVSALLEEDGLQVEVITGRNEALRQRLERLPFQAGRLKVRGFVEDMALHVAASDVVIGKTGPATVFETLAVGRPLLSPMRFGSAENKMARLLEMHGAGGYVAGPEQLLAAVRRFRSDPRRLELVEQRARAFDLPGMADRMARYIAHYARTREPAPDACGRGVPLTPLEQ
jgi:UDP-N-acetylglucosamine:LPS N-acetylglucosamine transferase